MYFCQHREKFLRSAITQIKITMISGQSDDWCQIDVIGIVGRANLL